MALGTAKDCREVKGIQKLIITAALTGGVTLPTQTPYLPITPEQIAEDAYRSWEAGAAIVHVHARDPITGKPTGNPEVFREILTRLKKRCNAVICVTTGGGLGMSREDRARAVLMFKPELSSLNMGSMNFSIHPSVRRIKEFKCDWEERYAFGSKDVVFRNTFEDLEYMLKSMKEDNIKPELEIYDVGQLYNAAWLIKDEILKPPVHMQFVTGVLGGIGSEPENILYLKNTADRLMGAGNYTWSVIGVGYPWQFYVGALSAIMGGHVRVGLEDNIYVERRALARSSGELVAKMVRIAKELDREVATPDEARRILGLKGSNQVNF